MYRLYIVEDDSGIAEAVAERARSWGMDVRAAENFSDIMSEFARYSPHIVLMDVNLPFYNGYHWCSEIRRVSSVPIIFISSVQDEMNKVMAMNMGADDFITKPFGIELLTAKIQALLRRAYNFSAASPVIEHRGAILETGDGSLVYNGKKITLTKNEYRILYILMQNKGKTVSREHLMDELWQTELFVDENTLTVNISRLRRKLEAGGLHDFITTKVGVGYIIGD